MTVVHSYNLQYMYMNTSKKDNVSNYYVCEYLIPTLTVYLNCYLNFTSFLLTIIIIFATFTLTIIIVRKLLLCILDVNNLCFAAIF